MSINRLLPISVCLLWSVTRSPAFQPRPSAEGLFCYSRPECGPWTWAGTCNAGHLNRQSPINLISTNRTTPLPPAHLSFSPAYSESLKAFSVQNTGHTVQVQLTEPKRTRLTFSGAGLEGSYVLAQVHFHWGLSPGTTGSEHLVDWAGSAGEVHFLHYSAAYGSLEEAIQGGSPSALAVIGVFLKEAEEGKDNFSLESIVRRAGAAAAAGSGRRKLEPLILRLTDLLPVESPSNYVFRYPGSLTTPPCSETVIWTLFKQPLAISGAQLEVLRSLKAPDGELVGNNYRPVQLLAGRRIKYYSLTT